MTYHAVVVCSLHYRARVVVRSGTSVLGRKLLQRRWDPFLPGLEYLDHERLLYWGRLSGVVVWCEQRKLKGWEDLDLRMTAWI